MPVDRRLDFKSGFSGNDAQPPILERIIEQYKLLYKVKAVLEVKLLVQGGCYFNSSVGTVHPSNYPSKESTGEYVLSGYSHYKTMRLSQINPLVGKLDLYANFDSQSELVTLEGESTFFADFKTSYDRGFLSSKKLILRPLRRDGLIYQFTDGDDINIFPQYGKDGKIDRLSAPSIASPLDDKGNNVNQLLFETAKVIYKSTAEILSELME